MGANHSRMTLRCGKGWPKGMGVGAGVVVAVGVIS
jgi:hypothetical protein